MPIASSAGAVFSRLIGWLTVNDGPTVADALCPAGAAADAPPPRVDDAPLTVRRELGPAVADGAAVDVVVRLDPATIADAEDLAGGRVDVVAAAR